MIFDAKHTSFHGKGLKILTRMDMLQRLPIVLVQVKSGSTSENLLNEICQIIHPLYWAKEITKKVYSSFMYSIRLYYKMHTIFLNSEYSKTSDPHRQFLCLSDKIDIKRSVIYVAFSNPSIYYKWNTINKTHKNTFKISTSM